MDRRVGAGGGRRARQIRDEPARSADIRALCEQVSEITQRTLIIDPAVTGEVTVISQEPLDEEGVWDLFQSVLRVQGFVAIRSGTIWRVIPQANMREAGVELSDEGGPSGRLDMVTRLVQLSNFPATTAVDALRPLVASFGYIQALPETNTLVITDNVENVDRIEDIARTLDEGDGSQVSTIPVRNADAKEIAAGLTSVLGSTDGTGLAPRVAIDARSNVLLVRGTPEMIDRVRVLVADLDQPGRELPSLIPITRVYRLQFADAASMVQVLRGVIGAQATATSSVVDSLGADVPAVQEPGIANGFGAAADIEAAAATGSATGASERELTFTPAVENYASEDITIQAAKDINAVVIRARAEVQSDLGAAGRPARPAAAAGADRGGDRRDLRRHRRAARRAARLRQRRAPGRLRLHLVQQQRARARQHPAAPERALGGGDLDRPDHRAVGGGQVRHPDPGARAVDQGEPAVDAERHHARQPGGVDPRRPERAVPHRHLRHRRQRLGPLHHHRAAGHRHPAQRHPAGEPGQRHPARREPGGLLDQQRGGAGRRRHHHQPPADPDLGARPTTAAPSCSAG